MEILFSIITLVGMGYAAFVGVKWMYKNGHISAAKRSQPLSPTDLKVLEESATRLMADLKATADECVARIEFAVVNAEHKMASLQSDRFATQNPVEPISIMKQSVSLVPDSMPDNPSHFDPQPGMTTGEIELLNGLRKMAR